MTFEDLTLDTAAGAPLIFARLTAGRTGAYIALELLSRGVTWGRVASTSILAWRRVSRGSGEGAGGVFKQPHRAEIFDPPHPPPVVACSLAYSVLLEEEARGNRGRPRPSPHAGIPLPPPLPPFFALAKKKHRKFLNDFQFIKVAISNRGRGCGGIMMRAGL